MIDKAYAAPQFPNNIPFINNLKESHHLSIDMDEFICDETLKEDIEILKNEAEIIIKNEHQKSIRNSFFKSKYELIEKQNKVLNSFFEKVDLILDNKEFSTMEKRKCLKGISIKIIKYMRKIALESRNDQGKLEDIFTAFTATNTNLWKALIDSKVLNSANTLLMCVPFFISFLPLSLRIAEYIFIQFHKSNNNSVSDILCIYEKLVDAINIEIEVLDEKLSDASEPAIQGSSSGSSTCNEVPYSIKGKELAYA